MKEAKFKPGDKVKSNGKSSQWFVVTEIETIKNGYVYLGCDGVTYFKEEDLDYQNEGKE